MFYQFPDDTQPILDALNQVNPGTAAEIHASLAKAYAGKRLRKPAICTTFLVTLRLIYITYGTDLIAQCRVEQRLVEYLSALEAVAQQL